MGIFVLSRRWGVCSWTPVFFLFWNTKFSKLVRFSSFRQWNVQWVLYLSVPFFRDIGRYPKIVSWCGKFWYSKAAMFVGLKTKQKRPKSMYERDQNFNFITHCTFQFLLYIFLANYKQWLSFFFPPSPSGKVNCHYSKYFRNYSLNMKLF